MSTSDRRAFLNKTLKLGCISMLSKSLPLLSAEASADSDLLSRMQWMNQPPSWHITGGTLTVHSAAKADFYRLPGWSVDNGNFFRLPVVGDFMFEARISGQYAARYDQAGLMVRLDPENWVKCGTEFVDGQRYASVVFTRLFSDWSTMKDLSDTAPVWWRVVRKKESIETLCSLDGKQFTSVRQGYFVAAPKLEVGLLCASLEGQGVQASFDSLKLTAI
jgi:regulation of enolase protein 1 (concanavalin A-like superfamily)